LRVPSFCAPGSRGLGNIAPSQSDYNQIVKGGGHGDFKMIALAPATVQEAIDLTYNAFNLAEKYRTLVVILLDGNIGQMMEPAELPPMKPTNGHHRPEWALTGASGGRAKNIITSIYLVPEVEEAFNRKLQEKYARIRQSEVRYVEYETADAEYLVVGFGTSGRVAQTAVKQARAQGIKVGLLRPISLWPFPEQRLAELAKQVRGVLVVEMNAGQMIDDVRLAVSGKGQDGSTPPVEFYGRMGGMVPLPDEVLEEIKKLTRAIHPSKGQFDILP
jgi:2-oxoglutarate ferredoxin oxidoreductase subunit alpha